MVIAVSAALSSSGCSNCPNPCRYQQQLVFRDQSGVPLKPLEVTDGERVRRCDSGGVKCEENTLTYDVGTYRDTAPHPISARAQTGEVFSGELKPVVDGSPVLWGCGCHDTLAPITLTLATQ